MGVSIEDLQLVWPRVYSFENCKHRRVEAKIRGGATYSQQMLDLLFSEAFYDQSGAEWLTAARQSGELEALLAEVRADASRVPFFTRPVLYRDRKGRVRFTEKPRLTFAQVRDRLDELFRELDGAGYFDSALGRLR
ncbi:hypothetical protein [Cellulomonas denverensis]|uniref:hypothetical protein n=1 Tax=Cellulomonas denverensis TaxID=264297 RepID=UPI0035ECE271